MRASMTSGRLLKRLAIGVIASLAAGYALATALVAARQRELLYNTADDGQLLAAAGLAVPDSRKIDLVAADGTAIAAWYVSPQPGRKVMLFFHGQGGQLVIQTGRWRRIREAGHGVLALSYRGYPGSTGSPTETGIHMDARAAFDWLAARHDRSEIVIHGHSLGTGVAVRLAAEVDAHALVLEAPFTAAVDVAAEPCPGCQSGC